jgi:hypothetical protein
MKLDLSPWARRRLGEAAVEALRTAPDDFRLSVSRGQSGWGATLIQQDRIGYSLIADVHGHPEPEDAIEAVMVELRPLLRPVLVKGDAA